MSYWDTVIQSNPYQQALAKNQSTAFAAQYPIYEQTTPQYPYPNPYNLANLGYRANELVFACMQKRMDAVSEPPMRVYDYSGDTPQELEDSPLRELIEHPCEGVTEKAFWQISENNRLTAGFSCWEKERNRMGQVIHLWPMRSDWVSFYRGQGRPIDRVRYQPYGLPPQDIDRDDVLIFMDYDPIYPLLKGLGAVAVAMRSIGVDNATTDYLKVFFQRGSVISGLLTSDQSLSDPEADRIQQRWGQAHGGVDNWAEHNIAVLGAGSKYQSIGMNFKEMAFEQLDGRDEARICAAFKVPPILIGAKVGLAASTFSNYGEARKAFYEETVTADWQYFQGEIDTQLLPEFADKAKSYYCEFDNTNVRALQEDRSASWNRSIAAAKQNVVTRDEAREEMGLDPIDNEPIFVGATVRETLTTNTGIVGNQQQDLAQSQADLAQENPDAPSASQASAQAGGGAAAGQNAALKAARDLERRQFRQFAAKRRKEGHPEKLAEFKFKHLPASEQAALLTELPGSAWRNYP